MFAIRSEPSAAGEKTMIRCGSFGARLLRDSLTRAYALPCISNTVDAAKSLIYITPDLLHRPTNQGVVGSNPASRTRNDEG
jgi:hypothetical protein